MIDECKIAWKQISNCISNLPQSYTLTNRKNQLEPIENWSLVPVRQSSRLLLAPIKDCMFIIVKSLFFFDALKQRLERIS